MSQSTMPLLPAALQRFLKRASQRVLMFALARCLLVGIAMLLGTGLAMLLLDAAFALPASLRIALDLLFIAAVAMALWRLVCVLRQGRFEPRRTAVQVEQGLQITDSRLINAVDLASAGPTVHNTPLCQSVIEVGDQLAKTLNPARVGSPKTLVPAMRLLGITALIGVLIYLAAPGIYRAGVPRYLAPTASHPAFTLLSFEVEITPEEVLFGQSAQVRVVIAGPSPPERASLVFVDDDDQDAQRLPMTALASFPTKDLAGPQTFFIDLDRLETTSRFYIDTTTFGGGGRSALYTLKVIPVPQFERVAVRYEFPIYTGWKASEHRLNQAGLRALVGTVVSIEVSSNVPLSGGELLFQPSRTDAPVETIPLIPLGDDPRVAVGSFTVTEDGDYEIRLSAFDGTPSTEHVAGPVTAVVDRPPRVAITDPPMTVMVPEGYSLPLRVEAGDDVGITRLELSYALNDGPAVAEPIPLVPDNAGGASVEVAYHFDLEAMGLTAGDTITYFAIAYDNRGDAFGGPQSATSQPHTIRVITMEAYLERERQDYRVGDIAQEFEDIMAQIAELEAMRDAIIEEMQPLLDKIANGEALTPEDEARLASLASALEDFERRLAELEAGLAARAAVPSLYEFEKPYLEQLAATSRQLAEQRRRSEMLRDAAEGLSQSPASQPLRQQFASDAQAFADDAGTPFDGEPQQQRELTQDQLEQLAMADRLMEQVERLKQTIAEQRRLEEALSEFEGQEALTPAEQLQAGQLAQEQAAVRQELVETLRRLEQLAGKAEDTLPQMSASARDLVERVEALAVTADMKDTQQFAMAGEGSDAHAAAQQAAEKLESLMEEASEGMRGMGQSGDPQIDGPLRLSDSQMGQAMEQMAQGRPASEPSQAMGEQPGTPQDGTGPSGGNAPLAVRGPAARPDLNGQRGSGGASQTASVTETDHHPESLDTQSNQGSSAAGVFIQGVPQQYRDDAEAYFRRLTEDSR